MRRLNEFLQRVGLSLREICALAILGFGVWMAVDARRTGLFPYFDKGEFSFGVVLIVGSALVLLKSFFASLSGADGVSKNIKSVAAIFSICGFLLGTGLAAIPAIGYANTLADARRAFDDLQSSVEQLTNESQRFGSENWRDVVPDVEQAVEDVETATSELEDKLTDRLSAAYRLP